MFPFLAYPYVTYLQICNTFRPLEFLANWMGLCQSKLSQNAAKYYYLQVIRKENSKRFTKSSTFCKIRKLVSFFTYELMYKSFLYMVLKQYYGLKLTPQCSEIINEIEGCMHAARILVIFCCN